ncbi:hypothetical protein ILUMI_12810 [Ignelater luminosus]|uniref:Transposase Helix-turn-helix domain-containing protein n=1 Tax=Ignelater luminosus TaxID=2038154 RepID=A0A8K0CTF4_IGNLU|nr:hypothetical protein ILUMI_12810 [Ignelater luminosus]
MCIPDFFQKSTFVPDSTGGREKISAKKLFLLVIWYLSNQESFREVADRFNVTFSSAHRYLKRILKFLLSIKSSVIKWSNDEEREAIIEGFRRKKGIDHVIGVIDGSDIEIPKPSENQTAYINRKGYHSLLLQGIVDRKKHLEIFWFDA